MISDLILCKDEIQILPALLTRLKGHCQQILVVDTGSTDGSLEVARVHAQVVQTELNFDFAAARNYGLGYVNQPWVLQIDADEWPNEALLQWMGHQIPRSYAAAYRVQRFNTIEGRAIENAWEWHIRLF